jgi:cytochrome c biogenesis protein CcmG, thiol:disulfide interchange protein DsbE
MNKKSTGLIGLTVLGVLLGSCDACRKQSVPAPQSNSATNARPSATESPRQIVVSSYGWALANKQRAKLDDYKGKVLVLDFYATWCEPCRFETPHLVELQKKYGEQGLQIVGLNVGGEDDYDKVPAYAKEFKIQYPLGIPDDALLDTYLRGADAIPQSLVFDRGGRLIKHIVGYDNSVDAELEQAIKTSLGSKGS